MRAVLVGSLYFVAAGCGILLSRGANGIASIWLANAVALAWFLPRHAREWPLGLFSIFVAGIAANLHFGQTLPLSLALMGANVVEISLAALLVRHTVGPIEAGAPAIAAYLRLQAVAAVIAPGIAGLLAALAAGAVAGPAAPANLWWVWWSGSTIGAITILPLTLTAERRALRDILAGKTFAVFAGVILLSMAFTYGAVTMLSHPFVVAALPLVLAALWLPPFATALNLAACMAVITVAAYMGFAVGFGGLAPHSVSINLLAALTLFPAFCISLIVAELRKEKTRIADSERHFRRAMEHSAVGMAIIGLDGRWQRTNRSLSDMLGYRPEEFAKLTFQDITHPDDLAADLGLLTKTLAGEIDNYRIEKRYLRKDGSLLWALLAVSLVRDEASGAPLHFISQIEDITARKNAEAALAASETRWQFAFESARQGVWDYDATTGKTFYSSVWKSILGYATEPVEEDSEAWWDFVHPDDVAVARAAGHEHVANNTPGFECEFRMRHKDGHWVWVLDRGKVIDWASGGKPRRMIGTHTDITARKETEERMRRLSERVRLAVQAGGVGLWELSPDTKEVWWDDRMCAIYGIEPTAFRRSHDAWAACLHPDDRERAEAEVWDAVAEKRAYDTEFRVILPSGELRHIRSVANLVKRPDGAPALLIGTNWDITETRHLTDALSKEKELLRVTLQSIGDAVIATDTGTRITFMNAVAEELTGWASAEALGRPVDEVIRFVDELSSKPLRGQVADCIDAVQPMSRHEAVVLVGKSGERRDIRESAAPVRTASGDVVGAVLVLQDMTRSRQLQRQLAHSATHDALTGLPNRTAFDADLAAACTSAADEQRQHALCFIDLDRFKIVNDTVGHAAGDALLREIGRVIRRTVRASDLTARLGGDEFALILRDCPMQQAERVATNVVEAIRSIPFSWGGRLYDVGASVGVTLISADSPSASDLLSQADVACYAAKADGRNRVALYQAGESEAHRHHLDLQAAANIRGAIEENRFRLFAQEIRALHPADKGQRQVEILLRLEDAGVLLDPALFIPAAERYGLMGKIDRWVVRAALHRYGERILREGDLSISINLSANSLTDREFWPFLQQELSDSQFPAERLRFEITETALIENLGAAHALVTAVRDAGCAILLDDFGTGLSSFDYLKRFPVDFVKIDGTFMQNLRESGVDRAIVESINDIAHKLGARTVAECVEDLDSIEILRSIGVDAVQGFAISRPQPLELFLLQDQAASAA